MLFEDFTRKLGLIIFDFGGLLLNFKILGFVYFLDQFCLKLKELSPGLISLAHIYVKEFVLFFQVFEVIFDPLAFNPVKLQEIPL